MLTKRLIDASSSKLVIEVFNLFAAFFFIFGQTVSKSLPSNLEKCDIGILLSYFIVGHSQLAPVQVGGQS